MNAKKVNLKVVSEVSDAELKRLTEGLKRIEGFEFLIDSEMKLVPD
jgi:hypothetical protein